MNALSKRDLKEVRETADDWSSSREFHAKETAVEKTCDVK